MQKQRIPGFAGHPDVHEKAAIQVKYIFLYDRFCDKLRGLAHYCINIQKCTARSAMQGGEIKIILIKKG